MLVDKPAGITSHDAVQRIRRALGIRAAGHTGTLDPFATGLLVVLLGRATRLARFVEAQAKTYLATARLGVRTDTDDLTGTVLGESTAEPAVPEPVVRQALAGFAGAQQQRPPVYSAKQVAGERSYRLARRGRTVVLPEVAITVHAIELLWYREPELGFRATVSAGTYLRAIARDLGDRLGVGAHLTALRREAIGPLRVEEAVALDQVGPAAVVPPRRVLSHLPWLELDEPARQAVVQGRAVPTGSTEPARNGGLVALIAAGELVAVANEADGWLRPTVVLGTA